MYFRIMRTICPERGSTMSYEHLLSPIEIRGHHYKNRVEFGPTLFALAVTAFPEITDNVYRMCEDRAAGGAAEVTTGEICINNEEGGSGFFFDPIDYAKYEGEGFEAIKHYADIIKKHGAVALLECCHEAAQNTPAPPYQPFGPVGYIRADGMEVLPFTEERMQKVCDDFRRFGKFAVACGFDGILLHGGHGFLVQQFLSKRTNTRTDEYGGSIENRSRFPLRVLEALREGLGEDKILELRLSASDGVVGGLQIEDVVGFAKLVDGKIDIFHVSNGLKIRGNATGTFSSPFDIHGVNVQYARKIKEVLKETKVAVIGGLNDPDQCEEIIANGWADFVVFGRQGFADPEFVKKLEEGRADHIRKCIRCCVCYPGGPEEPTDPDLINFNPPPCTVMGTCTINPDSGFGRIPRDQRPPVKEKKNVLIIGGGPAGMQAAITAGERGHNVTLIEKDPELGGMIKVYAQADQHKKDIRNFMELLKMEANENAKVITGEEVTPETIANADADVVILAVGARERTVDIPGIESAKYITDAYADIPENKKILIAGGGESACETAIMLAEHGNDVTIVLRGTVLAKNTRGIIRNALFTEIRKNNIQVVFGTQCQSFEDGAMAGIDAEGKEVRLEADIIYFAFGEEPKELAQELKAACGNKQVILIGDCSCPGKIGGAIHSGYEAAMSIGI